MLEKFLGKYNKKWLISNDLTAADFQFYEHIDVCWLITNDSWKEYPNVLKYLKRFQEIPELKPYLQSQEYRSMAINAKFARFGAGVEKHQDKN
ncbi:unnamed protein product [Didymodactylos carnosus]|nr:unnamed protein product [Didymodactylos carnosus]CAF3851077.1 unnamed protein product [Didymodactylos carnosus]